MSNLFASEGSLERIGVFANFLRSQSFLNHFFDATLDDDDGTIRRVASYVHDFIDRCRTIRGGIIIAAHK